MRKLGSRFEWCRPRCWSQCFANLHLYSSKSAAVMLYLLIVSSFLFDGYNSILFGIACLSYTVSSIEMLVLQLSVDRVDEHMGSIFWVWREARG